MPIKPGVVVAGGGTAGIMAAVAAAREGCPVTVLEQEGFAGGVAAFGIPFLAFLDGRGRRVVGGLPQELVERLIGLNASPGHVGGAFWAGLGRDCQFAITPYDPEIYKALIMQMAAEAGVVFKLHSFLAGVDIGDGGRIKSVRIANKNGLEQVEGSVFIDATGDADLARLSGCPCRLGQDGAAMQNVSGIFILGGVDIDRAVQALRDGDGIEGWGSWHNRLIRGGLVDGKVGYNHFAGHLKPWRDDRRLTFTAVSWREGVLSLNISRTTGINGCVHEDLVRAELQERQNMFEIYSGLRRNIPGFQESYLISTSPMVGIRESANIIGSAVMNLQDVVDCAEHADNVARGCYPIDIHDPRGGSTQFIFLKDGGSYGIPYRALIPRQTANLLAAGRCISTDHQAHGTVRIMATAMAVGQAAGTAAAMAAAEAIPVAELDAGRLRARLRLRGAILDPEDIC